MVPSYTLNLNANFSAFWDGLATTTVLNLSGEFLTRLIFEFNFFFWNFLNQGLSVSRSIFTEYKVFFTAVVLKWNSKPPKLSKFSWLTTARLLRARMTSPVNIPRS